MGRVPQLPELCPVSASSFCNKKLEETACGIVRSQNNLCELIGAVKFYSLFKACVEAS